MALSPIGQKLAGQFNKPTNTGLLKISNPSLVNPPVKFGVDIPKPVLPNTNFSTANTTPRAVQPTLLSEIGKKLWQGNIGGAIGNEAVNATRGGVAVNTLLGLPKNTLKVGKEILQGTARVTATAGITAGNAAFRAVGQPEPFAPSTPTNNNPVTNAVFGGVPVKNLSTYGQTALDMIESSTGKKINPKTAPFVGALGIATEFYGGPGKKGVVDLSTKLLTKLEGKTTVSKQFISDLTNSPDLKQAEKDLIRRILETEGDKVDVPAFASKVRGELLPLQSKQHLDDEMMDVPGGGYENTTLPPEIRGPVYNYNERVYESPVKTSAGNVHSGLPKSDSYFAHSRYEDMADEMLPDGTPGYNESGVRRIIEIQSDLFQKGRLDEEKGQWGVLKGNESRISVGEAEMIKRLNARESEVSKLEPYRNTWQDRIVREEVKKAAMDGKTKLQFPTGETAMKIEGLGENTVRWNLGNAGGRAKLTTDNLKVGLEVQEGMGTKWIITDILGDGKFKAVKKDVTNWTVEDGRVVEKFYNTRLNKTETKPALDLDKESFDISGKVDQNNPIYKFYEKEMGRYLKNKYGAERVTDAQGVSWWEVPVKKEYGTQPVEAFKRGDKNYTKNVTLANLKADIKRIIGVDLPIFGKDFMGEGVEGSFYRGIINILEKGGKVSDFVGKHETWHLIKNGLVTKEEKAIIEAMEQDLIKQFPKKAKALRDEGYSPEEIAEELMANEFARYYQKGTTFSEKLKVIFDKIIQRVTLIVKNKSQVLTYFKDIQSKSTGVIKGNGGRIKYAMNGEGKSISPIDRLIAEGKVRVRSKNGKDIYEIKKGGNWKTVRDEDSAIKQLTPVLKPVVKKVEVTPIPLTGDAPVMSKEQLAKYETKLIQLSSAEAGERVGQFEESGKFMGYRAKRSTFPAHYAENLRSKKLFDKYMDGVGGRQRQGVPEDFLMKYKEGSLLDQLDQQVREDIGLPMLKREAKADIKQAKLQQKLLTPKTPKTTRVSKAEVKSLEEVANQQLEAIPLPPREKPVSLKEIVTQTPVGKKIGLQDFIRTPDRILRKIGFGKESDLLRDQYEKYVIELPKNMKKITDWSKQVPRGASNKLFRYLDGEDVILTKEEMRVASEIKQYLSTWADRLKLPADKRVTNYITRLFEDQLIKKEFDEDLAKLIADKIPGQVYDPFLEKRLGAKGYRQDVWAALDAYTKRATRKVHMDPALERIREKAGSSLDFTSLEKSQFEYIQNYIDKVNMRPSDLDTATDNMIKDFIGYRLGQRPLTRMLKFLRQRTYVGMLGGNLSSALRNLSQGANTYATLGEKYTAIGYSKLFSPSAMKEASEQGIFANNFIEDRTINATMKLVQKVDNVLFTFFDTAEKINRGAAYHGAKAKAISKGMSEEEAIRYAKKVVRKTQFNYDVLDQPALLSSDIAKTIGQFSSYPLKQSEFLIELAKDKNLLGLLRYAGAGMLFVYTIGQAFGMEPKEILPSFRFGVPPSMKFPAEVTKAVLDSPDKYGKDRDLKKKLKDIGNSTLGLIPGGIQAKKTIQGYEAMKQGQSETSNGNKQFDVGGTPLKDAQALAFGKYANKQAKDYFDGVKTPEEKLIAEKAAEKQKAKDLIKKKIQPIYDQAQELKAQGKVAEANALVANFTEEEKTVYKGIKQAEQADHTRRLRDLLSINSPEAVTYLRSLSKDEQQRIGTTILTDEERKQYAELKSQVQ